MILDACMADDILLQVLASVDVEDVLGLLVTSASTTRRLVDPGDGRVSIAQRLAIVHLGQAVTTAVIAACRAIDKDACLHCWPWCEGPVAVLRVLVCTSACAQAFRHGLRIAALGSQAPGASPLTCEFLCLLCKSKIRRTRSGRPRHTATAAAEAALAVLLVTKPGIEILRASAAAMTETELELDRLVEIGDIKSIQSAYRAISERRSAVDFLRHHCQGLGAEGELARIALDSAVDALDLTVRGYMEEGYELAQDAFDFLPPPNLVLVPYDRQYVYDEGNSHMF